MKVSVAEVCARVFLRVSDLPRVVVRPLGCQNRGFSYSTGCNLCANTPALIFPLGNLWFWSIYLQEQSCTVIPCVSFLVRPGPCFSGCAFYRLPFFFFFYLPTHKSFAQTRTLLFVCAVLFLTYQPASQCFSPPPTCARVRLESLSDCDGLERCPGSLRVRRSALFVFHCCSNNGSPRAGSPPN